MNDTNNIDNRVLQVPIEDIIPNRFQPRLAFDEKSLNELASSIKQHGVIQPLVLRRVGDKYEIIAGERRYKASTMAGLASVPAIITDMDDNKSAEVAIVENVQRKDLTAIEEARSYKALLDKGYMTQEDLAKKMGLSQAAISNKLRLLTLDESVQDAVLHEQISERHARTLLKLESPIEQKNMLKRIIEERLTVRQLEEEVKKMTNQPEVPKVEMPDIDNMINNAEDIVPPKPKEESPIQQEVVVDVEPSIVEAQEAAKMPNKFFNFLEDEAANMSFEEPVELPKPEETPEVIEEAPASAEEIKAEENEPEPIVEEPSPVEEVIDAPVEPLVTEPVSVEEEIEMLDDFVVPTPQENVPNVNINEIINKIRNLNLESDKVKIEELDLPNEYQINIKISKD